MDAAAEIGRNHVESKHYRFSLSMEMSKPTRDGTAEHVLRKQIHKHEPGQGNIHFPCSAEHEQDWQPYPVLLTLAIGDVHKHTYIQTCIHTYKHAYIHDQRFS